MVHEKLALYPLEKRDTAYLSEDSTDMVKLLQSYREQNRFLSECNIKLEKALTALTHSGNNYRADFGLSTASDTPREAVLIYDRQGKIIESNQDCAGLFRLSEKQLTGKSVVSLFPADRRHLIKHLKSAYSQGASRFETRLFSADRATVYVDVNIENCDENKGLFRLSARDITNIVNTREQLMHNRVLTSLGEMMAGIAHEVNNPLGIILLYSELLLKNDEPQQNLRDLKIIHGEAKRAVRVLSALLTYTRRSDLQPRKVNLNRILRGNIRMRRYAHKVANITDRLILPDSPTYVFGNIARLTQVFNNILLNAEEVLKTRQGGTITTTLKNEKGRALVSIADDGTGIGRENMDKIFFPFFTTKGPGEGTGLGLSTCYGIVTGMNGLIYAENNDVGGATFTVELPLWRRR